MPIKSQYEPTFPDQSSEVEAWIIVACEKEWVATTGSSDLYRSFYAWLSVGISPNVWPVSAKKFSMLLHDLGYVRRKSHGVMVFEGLALRPEESSPSHS